MPNIHPFKALLALVRLDLEVHALMTQNHLLQGTLEELNQKIAAENAVVETAHHVVHTAQKHVDSLELDGKTTSEHMRTLSKKQLSTNSSKEYLSLDKELAPLKTREERNELDLIRAWDTLERAQEEYQRVVQDRSETLQALRKEFESVTAHRASIDKTIREHLASRESQRATVPAEWLERYEALRERMHDPIVAITTSACPVCYNTLPDKDMINLHRGAILRCRECQRYLYDAQEVGREHPLNELIP